MKTQQEKLNSAIEFLTEKHNAEWCNEYGEPGYTNPEQGIIFANWNNIPNGLADWLEKIGYALEWSDEWSIDYSYSKAYRTSPDSYGWQPSFIYTADGEMCTPDNGPDAAIEVCANDKHNQPVQPLPHWVSAADLTDAGYILFESNKESGFFPGQTDNPQDSINHALDAGFDSAVILKTEQSQFYSKWECWAYAETSGIDYNRQAINDHYFTRRILALCDMRNPWRNEGTSTDTGYCLDKVPE